MGEGVEAFSTRKESALPYYVIQPHQVHEDKIAIIDNPYIDRENLRGIDALITSLDGCAIGVRSADCVPILLYDSVNSVIAAIHSGWRGTVKRISQKTVRQMTHEFGTVPASLRAVIGPSIGPEAFEVKSDVVDAFQEAGFQMGRICKAKGSNTFLIDLWEANKSLLVEMGMNPQNIQVAGICSYTNHNEFYSARYEHDNKCGRTINVIKLKV